MAYITGFRHAPGDRRGVHKPVECGWSTFEVEGRRLLQLDTYGSDDRAMPGKTSQSVQLDEEAARTLVGLLRETFPGLDTARRDES